MNVAGEIDCAFGVHAESGFGIFLDAANGRLLSTIDEDHRAGVCVIGPDLAAKLFDGIDPIGQEIRAGQGRYEIISVAAPKGSVLGQTQDNFVMIPLGTYRKEWLAPQDSVQIFVAARSRQEMSRRTHLSPRRTLTARSDIASRLVMSCWAARHRRVRWRGVRVPA